MLAGKLPYPQNNTEPPENNESEPVEVEETETLLSRMQKERCQRIRTRAPARRARAAAGVFRARPRNRLGSASDLRRSLEDCWARPPRPTPTSSWRPGSGSAALRGAQQRDRRPARAPDAQPPRPRRLVMPLVAASLALIAAATAMHVDYRAQPSAGTSPRPSPSASRRTTRPPLAIRCRRGACRAPRSPPCSGAVPRHPLPHPEVGIGPGSHSNASTRNSTTSRTEITPAGCRAR